MGEIFDPRGPRCRSWWMVRPSGQQLGSCPSCWGSLRLCGVGREDGGVVRVGHEKLAFYKPCVRVRPVGDKVGELFLKALAMSPSRVRMNLLKRICWLAAALVRLPLSSLMRVNNLEELYLMWEQDSTRSIQVLWLVVLMSSSTCWKGWESCWGFFLLGQSVKWHQGGCPWKCPPQHYRKSKAPPQRSDPLCRLGAAGRVREVHDRREWWYRAKLRMNIWLNPLNIERCVAFTLGMNTCDGDVTSNNFVFWKLIIK